MDPDDELRMDFIKKEKIAERVRDAFQNRHPAQQTRPTGFCGSIREFTIPSLITFIEVAILHCQPSVVTESRCHCVTVASLVVVDAIANAY